MGQYKLNEMRSKTYKSNIKGLDERGRRNLQMSLINDYLNGYSGKLSLQNGSAGDKNQKIKLDK